MTASSTCDPTVSFKNPPDVRRLREVLGFMFDLAPHLASAVGAFVARARGSSLSVLLILTVVAG